MNRPLPDLTCTDRRNEVVWLALCGEHAKQSDVLLCIIYFVLTTDQATNKQNLIKTDLVAMVFIHLSHRKQCKHQQRKNDTLKNIAHRRNVRITFHMVGTHTFTAQ